MPTSAALAEETAAAAPAAEGEQQQQQAEPAAKAAITTSWRVYDSWILQDVYGSDHLPLGLTLVQEAA